MNSMQCSLYKGVLRDAASLVREIIILTVYHYFDIRKLFEFFPNRSGIFNKCLNVKDD
ncbi:Uncharacterised protein [Serratia quinivorans]|nr:Uncharacterised protein [Serratia quinivorans]